MALSYVDKVDLSKSDVNDFLIDDPSKKNLMKVNANRNFSNLKMWLKTLLCTSN